MKFTQLFILQSAVIYFFGNLRAKFWNLNPAGQVWYKQIVQTWILIKFQGDAFLNNGLNPDIKNNVANERGPFLNCLPASFLLVCCFFAVLIEVPSESVPNWIWPFFPYVSSSFLAVAVIKASELWAAMEPELLITVGAELEPVTETEKQQEEGDENNMEEENDRATAVQIAQYLRVNKYRWCQYKYFLEGGVTEVSKHTECFLLYW